MTKVSAHFRWCLTGTPIQNRLEDVGSLLIFLRIAPFDDILEFGHHIVSPIIKGTSADNLRLLLDSICLRRTKVLLDLPTLHDQDRLLDLSSTERELYERTESNIAQAIQQQVMIEKSSKSYLGIFQLQLQLRRICNHGTLLTACTGISRDVPIDPEEAIAVLQDTTDATCAYCGFKSANTPAAKKRKEYLTTCGHLLCSDCVASFEAALSTLAVSAQVESNVLQCPLCPKKVTKNYLIQSKVSRTRTEDRVLENDSHATEFDSNGFSTKISGMVEDIEMNKTQGKGYYIGDISITSTLAALTSIVVLSSPVGQDP